MRDSGTTLLESAVATGVRTGTDKVEAMYSCQLSASKHCGILWRTQASEFPGAAFQVESGGPGEIYTDNRIETLMSEARSTSEQAIGGKAET